MVQLSSNSIRSLSRSVVLRIVMQAVVWSRPERGSRAATAGGAPPGFSLGGLALKCWDTISRALGSCCGVPVILQQKIHSNGY